ncbi:hypothetical protein BGZ98_010234, partial [Dissophora globulifera]
WTRAAVPPFTRWPAWSLAIQYPTSISSRSEVRASVESARRTYAWTLRSQSTETWSRARVGLWKSRSQWKQWWEPDLAQVTLEL